MRSGLLFARTHWISRTTWLSIGRTFLAILGALWLLVEVVSFFMPDIQPTASRPALFSLVVGTSFGLAIFCNRPKLRFERRVPGKDTTIEIKAGDIFSQGAPIVIGVNAAFDTDPQIISPASIQGQFTNRFFRDHRRLAESLSEKLQAIAAEEVEVNKPGNTTRYPIGTAVTMRSEGQTVHFVAAMHIDEQGTAASSRDKFYEALSSLWVHLKHNGEMEPIALPILGSRFGRLNLTRETLIKEIVLSFLAACQDDQFCERLVVVVHPNDVVRHEIDFQELDRFVSLQCENVHLNAAGSTGRGAPSE